MSWFTHEKETYVSLPTCKSQKSQKSRVDVSKETCLTYYITHIIETRHMYQSVLHM